MIEREAPGMSLAMLMGSLNVTPLGMLSRSEKHKNIGLWFEGKSYVLKSVIFFFSLLVTFANKIVFQKINCHVRTDIHYQICITTRIYSFLLSQRLYSVNHRETKIRTVSISYFFLMDGKDVNFNHILLQWLCVCRPVCGIRGKTLIINLPGSKKGSQVGTDYVFWYSLDTEDSPAVSTCRK